MAETLPSPPDDNEPESADAQWVDRERPDSRSQPASEKAPLESAGEAYEIEGGHDDSREGLPSASLVPPVSSPPRKPKPAPKPQSRAAGAPAEVDRVWSRWSEWGPNLALLAAAGAAIALLVVLSLAAGFLVLAVFFVLIGGAILLVLSYPIAITLERPVRVTPEQAVRDYFAALSHHLPHYRRMWLLLSSAGRASSPFASYGGFKAYWNERLAALHGNPGARLNPLVFTVADFRSEKSAGLSAIDVAFQLRIAARETPEAPLASYQVEMGLVKGPDRMWYLNRGTLPDEST
jgi:hypothetical protein